MRTTLSLDDDVSTLLLAAKRRQDKSFKQIVNEALRQGLKDQPKPARRAKLFLTGSVNLGRCLVGTLDDVAETLALGEGESFS